MKRYKTDLLSDLRDADYAAKYVSACAAESQESLLLALRDVAQAREGVAKAANAAGLNRENLYRILSEEGNPRLDSLYSVLKALDLQISVETANRKPASGSGRNHRVRATTT